MNYKKLIIGLVLIAILFFLLVYSSLMHNKYDPDIDYIHKNFEKYNNTELNLGGQITDINYSKQVIYIKNNKVPDKDIKVDIANVNFNGEIGDHIEILGLIDSPYHITAKKILVSTSWKFDLVYIRSLPAIPFALYLFFRTYKFNKKTYQFERREKEKGRDE